MAQDLGHCSNWNHHQLISAKLQLRFFECHGQKESVRKWKYIHIYIHIYIYMILYIYIYSPENYTYPLKIKNWKIKLINVLLKWCCFHENMPTHCRFFLERFPVHIYVCRVNGVSRSPWHRDSLHDVGILEANHVPGKTEHKQLGVVKGPMKHPQDCLFLS